MLKKQSIYQSEASESAAYLFESQTKHDSYSLRAHLTNKERLKLSFFPHQIRSHLSFEVKNKLFAIFYDIYMNESLWSLHALDIF